MGFDIDQPARARDRRVVRRRHFEPDAKEIAQRQRIGRTPGDATLRVNALEIPNQQQPEVDARRHARSAHRLRVEAGALGFDEIVESVLAQQLIQPPIERMTRGPRQVCRCHPHGHLSIAFAFAHRHGTHSSTLGG
jgi:hypothetical protein